MSVPHLHEPPTEASLRSARLELSSQLSDISDITNRINTAETALAEFVASSQRSISALIQERGELESRLATTQAYLAPIKRLPHELLRAVFDQVFEEYACAAWVLSGVCRLWRRLTFGMPRIWSKIRLVTTQNSSADTIRLWLERSGPQVPLDIEIFLHVNTNKRGDSSSSEGAVRRRRNSSPSPLWLAPPTHLPIPPPSHFLPPGQTPLLIPPSPPPWGASPPHSSSSSASPGERGGAGQSRSSMHWGHIAIYYLVQQMHRWEKFVFRFDKQFSSMQALKSIAGDAPMLQTFEVSCAEPAFYPDWPWLPSAPANTTVDLPRLQSLTLQYTPFKWSSPVLRTNLRSLTLRALPASHLPLDRIMHIVSANASLESLSLHFSAALPAILPLTPTSLPELKELSLGGHYLMSQLAESLITPILDSLSLDIEARDPIEDTISNLCARSNNPPLSHLSVAYSSSSSSYYYGPGGVVISWNFLTDLSHLESLRVGGTPFEPLLSALGPPGDDQDVWMCPALTSLAMKNCHAHGDGVGKLVQMVEARNPHGGGTAVSVGGVVPAKLRKLELYECASVGIDVLAWLEGRIEAVECTDPIYERSPLTSNPYL